MRSVALLARRTRTRHCCPRSIRCRVQGDFQPEEGLADLLAINGLAPGKAMRARVWGPDFEAGVSRVKIYHRDQPLDLAEIVPVLERMGLRVRAEVGYPIRLAADDGAPESAVYVHDLAIDRPAGQKRLDARFEQSLRSDLGARHGEMTVSTAWSLRWERIGVQLHCCALCRAIAASPGLDPSEPVQVRALAEHPDIANNLLNLFAIKFDPQAKGDIDQRRKDAAPVVAEIQKQLEAVATLDADRALRRCWRW
jgi:glutamate dehydrogenase